MILGTVAEIHRYPVKSMSGEAMSAAQVSTHGIAGDRSFALFDPSEKRVISAPNPLFPRLLDFSARYAQGVDPSAHRALIEITLPDGRLVRSDDPACIDVLSAWFERPVALGCVNDDDSARPASCEHSMAGTFFDYAPLHVVTLTALAEMGREGASSTFATRRFRPNLLLELTSGDGFPENEWVGKRLRIGDQVVLDVTDPCPRCVMATMAQGDLPRDPEVLKAIARRNMRFSPFLGNDQPCLGAYAFVSQSGLVSVGDPVRLEL